MTSSAAISVPRRALRRVIPIAATDVRAGFAVTLISLDDYTSGFEIRGCLLTPYEHPARSSAAERAVAAQERLIACFNGVREGAIASNVAPMVLQSGETSQPRDLQARLPNFAVDAEDDRGNTYDLRGHGAGSHGDGEYSFELSLSPALDLAARILRIEVSAISWRGWSSMDIDPSPLRIDSGPWIAVVDLTAGRDAVQTGRLN